MLRRTSALLNVFVAPRRSQHTVPKVGVSVALMRRSEKTTEVLLIKRAKEPALGLWALPGGHLELGEKITDCAARELEEEACISPKDISVSEAIHCSDSIYKNDGVVSYHFLLASVCALVIKGRESSIQPIASTDASDVRWFNVSEWNDKDVLFYENQKIIPGVGTVVNKAVRMLDRDWKDQTNDLAFNEKHSNLNWSN
ncbi:hypothetical protein AKO1_005878 [Acrasis kona]|uniref:Nudix hydrolase domain-containing protein n=1 Tax=Acrasis kona TaxID=1008807 RepID=A0AAW2YID8_9EUKA